MKKRLFLLPLVGGFLLAGCSFELFGQKINLNLPWENQEAEQQKTNTGTGTGTGTGNNQNNGGQNQQTADYGELVATLDLHEDKSTSKSAEEVIISDQGVSLKVEKNGAQQDAGGTDQAFVANPLRIYSLLDR